MRSRLIDYAQFLRQFHAHYAAFALPVAAEGFSLETFSHSLFTFSLDCQGVLPHDYILYAGEDQSPGSGVSGLEERAWRMEAGLLLSLSRQNLAGLQDMVIHLGER